MGEKVFKYVGMGAAVGAAAFARVVTEKGWRAVMASDPPSNPEDLDTELWEALLWAAASGAVIALARMYATRQWTRYYAKSTGHLPANPNDIS
ncbi:Protein of unknown function [Austwickia chelonae]|uniref:DUF4235 domain-containing protein n=1 Tax=Austwickia chelonae NBRC 105200 TaxID=1184607 RepID=K6V897_9MICO|nr:DUF4235 domain-containing protein [Austwickia chelonae]GAB78448.1 hypothetical protein AUCHE_09_00540 [Austwickia chelonae NBRC 105200]SEW39659.1 Protein of unknown function [Austwickia chelonae]